MNPKTVRIGAGAGYGGDRFEPALDLVQRGEIQYLVYECMAERTIALYQQDKMKDPALGYNPQLERRLDPVLQECRKKGIKIITNMGAANPRAAVDRVIQMARRKGLAGLRVAAVLGDDVLDSVTGSSAGILETGETVAAYVDRIVSANAYLGCEPIVECLDRGADVILTGRVADPSLFLSPLVHEFGWLLDDYALLGQGTVVGHLLECAGQVTGGYFADPGYKDVPQPWALGFPIAEVSRDGPALITKPPGSGGVVDLRTCKEQLLYEIHDPSAYYTPDCVADFTGVTLEQAGQDVVRVTGGRGNPRTDTLKVSIGYRDSFVGEGQISYAGPGAVERARLAAAIVQRRLEITGVHFTEIRFDLIGIDSLHGEWISRGRGEPYETRLRVVARTGSKEDAARVGEEVETLWTNGPAGGGGATKSVREVIGVVSTMIPRSAVKTQVVMEVA
ncbi:MAG: acyclic terpene utilization AtuA family protein [Ignavibacteriales bacterium]